MSKEIWKDIPGYEGRYQVSNLGRVKSLDYWRTGKAQIMKAKNHAGYCRVVLWKDGKAKEICVHRLVSLVFIPNPENKPYVNHIDGDRRNNKTENLEWVTAQENTIHSVTVLGNNPNKWSSTPIIDAETGMVFPTQVAAAEFFKTSQGNVGRVARLNCHTIRGHHLFFADKKNGSTEWNGSNFKPDANK